MSVCHYIHMCICLFFVHMVLWLCWLFSLLFVHMRCSNMSSELPHRATCCLISPPARHTLTDCVKLRLNSNNISSSATTCKPVSVCFVLFLPSMEIKVWRHLRMKLDPAIATTPGKFCQSRYSSPLTLIASNVNLIWLLHSGPGDCKVNLPHPCPCTPHTERPGGQLKYLLVLSSLILALI